MAGKGDPKTVATTPAKTHPAPPLRCTLPLASQDRKIQGTRAEPIWKAIQRSSGPIKADRTAALQRWSGNRITCAALGCADYPRATEERSGVCTEGNPDPDSGHSKKQRGRQSITEED